MAVFRRGSRFHLVPRRTHKTTRTPLALHELEDRLAPAALRVALVSDAVAQADAVAAAAAKGVVVRVYDAARTDTTGLVDLLGQVSAEHGRAQIGRMALVTHGAAGQVTVGGGDVWGLAGWNAQPDAWTRLRSLLAADARLDLYSCSTAAGPAGRALVADLARLTGAAVYASTDPVASGTGGDFVWETVTRRAAGTADLFPAARLERIAGLRLEDLYEPNDTKAEVDAAAEGATNSPNLGAIASPLLLPSLALQDSADWFRVVTTKVGTSHDYARIAWSSAQGDLDIEIRAADGISLWRFESASFGSAAEVSFQEVPPGTYYVRVFDQAGAPNVDYALTIDPPGNEPDDVFEANDTKAEVDAATVGGVNSPNLGLLSAVFFEDLKLEDGADWFKVVTDRVGTSHDYARVTFATGTNRDGDLDVEIRAADGISLWRQDLSAFGTAAEVSFQDIPAGTYYVRVFDSAAGTGTGMAGNANSSYALTIDPPGNEADDDYEVNDTRDEVDGQPAGATNSPNRGLLTSPFDRALKLEDGADWFKVVTDRVGTSHDFARVTFATGTNRDGDLDVEIRAADGISIWRQDLSAFGTAAEVSFQELPAGTYYVRVFDSGAGTGTGVGGSANSAYNLVIDPPGNEPDDAFEPNDSRDEVDARPAGVFNSPNLGTLTATFQRTLKLEDGADWFRFETAAVGTSHDYARVTFATGTDRDGDLDVELRAPDGTLLRQDLTSFGTAAEVSLQELPAGTYYVRVYDSGAGTGTGIGGNANSSYTLTINPPGNELEDPYEPNDSMAEIATRIPGEVSSPNLGVRVMQVQAGPLRLEDAADWFRFETTATSNSTHFVRITFTVDAALRNGDLDLQLVHPDGTVIASELTATGAAAEISLSGQPAGVYFVRVFDSGAGTGNGIGGSANTYQLTINPPTGGPLLSLSVNPTTVSETAGPGAATATLTRTGPTGADLVVNLVSSRPGEVSVPPTVTIPAGQVGITFPVDAIDDQIINSLHSSFLTAYVDGFASGLAVLTLTDNDSPPAVIVSHTGSNTAVIEGGAGDAYTVVLTTRPSADVTVNVLPGGQLTAAPTTLTFTPADWFTAQTVAVDAIDDSIREGAHTSAVNHTAVSADSRYNNITIPSLPVSIADNDVAGVLIVESGGSTAVTEGGANDTYTIALASRPTANVNVLLGTSNQLGASPASLVFTPGNWNVPQPVTVTAANDLVGEGTHSAVVTHVLQGGDPNYNGQPVGSVTVTITDNDTAPGILIAQSGGSTVVTENGPGDSYAVTLATQPTANVIVTPTFGGQVGVTPTVLTFTPGNWNVPQPVSVSAINDVAVEGTQTVPIAYTVASSDPNYNNLPAPGVVVTVLDDDQPLSAGFDVFALLEDDPATPLAVLANDAGVNIFISAVTQGAGGTVAITGGGTGLTYQPRPGFTGPDVFTYTITDHNGVTATAGVFVNVGAANDAPTLTVPGPQGLRVNTPLTINGIVVADPDVFQGTGQVEVRLAVQNGTLTLPTTGGLIFAAGDGTADAAMTFTGLLSSVTTALGGLVYTQPLDTLATDMLSIDVSDLGNIGAGGALTAAGSVAIIPLTGQVVVQPNPFTPALRDLVVYGTAGDDTVLVTAKGANLTALLNGSPVLAGKVTGRVLLFGAAGNDSLSLVKVGRVGVLVGGAGNDMLIGGSKNDRLTGGDGNDSVDGGKGTDRLVETGDVDFTLVQGTKTTDGSLTGLGTDVLVKISVEEAELTGGAGANTLDASGFTGKATLIGGAGNDTLRASVAGGLMLGGAGDDLLLGAAGRDVLMGGTGLDTLTGGANEDILIGGTTVFDADPAARASIEAEWSRKPGSYALRVKRLTGLAGGGKNGTNLLTALTVAADGEANVLTGGDGLDWFFARELVDSVTDFNTGGLETRTNLT